MTTILFFLNLIGCFILLNTSKKAVLFSSSLEKYLQQNDNISRIVGVFFLLVSLILATQFKGLTGGLLFSFIVVILAFSLVVIIAPLRLINYKGLLVVFVFSLLIEIFI